MLPRTSAAASLATVHGLGLRSQPRRARRRVTLALLAGVAAFVLAGSPSPAVAAGGAHPHFADGGTLVWYRSLPEAQAVARAENKLILIESGRLHCTQCRRLVSQILPQEPVRSRLRAVAIGFADDCDDETSPCRPLLAQHLPGATMLPLVGFVTPDLRWVTGWYGGTTQGAVLQHLSVAEDRCRRLAASPPPARPLPSPVARAMPTPPPVASRPTPPPAATTPALPVAPSRPRIPHPEPLALAGPDRALPADPEGRPPPAVLPLPPAPVAPAPPLAAPPLPLAAPRPVGSDAPNPIARARAAAVKEEWGEVLRLQENARALPTAEAVELAALADRAHQWVARTMSDAERHAIGGRPDAASRLLDRVARELSGSIHPASVDAVRGLDAMRALAQIQASMDAPTTADLLRKDAYARFRGSRWAAMFRSR